MQANKSLVRSSFESQEWVDRIAANPSKERSTKNGNRKINTSQHAKLSFATAEKKQRPELTFKKQTAQPPDGQFKAQLDSAPQSFQSSVGAGNQVRQTSPVDNYAHHTVDKGQSRTAQLNAMTMKPVSCGD